MYKKQNKRKGNVNTLSVYIPCVMGEAVGSG
jgi:hypothetical protein